MQTDTDVPSSLGRTPADDPHRPRYHFLPPANWMNDPNGLIQWDGTYHLFYQYNPNGPFHGTIHWGHAASEDLIHWQHLPIALAPTPGAADEDGCWSGCTVNDGGVPTLIYSGSRGREQRPCLARSDDGLLTWRKDAGNPVIADVPPGLDLVGFRDHAVWRESGLWYQLIGAGIRGRGGAALLYRSADLRRWEYLHPLLVGDLRHHTPVWTGAMWECPDLFALGGRHVLLVSVCDESRLYYSAAITGQYRDQRLTPAVEHKLDYGDRYFYAPQSFTDGRGRRIVFGWAQEGRSQDAQRAAGWAGVMSLPRELAIGPHGQVTMRPTPELCELRAEHASCPPLTAPEGTSVVLPGVAGDGLELVAELVTAEGGRGGLALRRSPDEAEQTVILYDGALRQLIVDRSRSSLDPNVERGLHVAPLTLAAGEPLRLHLYLDRSVLEVFANDRVSITSRIYPTHPESCTAALVAESGATRLTALDAWGMRSIWEV